jgi:hypothetical protein
LFKEFSLLDADLQAVASNFDLKYGDGNEDKKKLRIHPFFENL